MCTHVLYWFLSHCSHFSNIYFEYLFQFEKTGIGLKLKFKNVYIVKRRRHLTVRILYITLYRCCFISRGIIFIPSWFEFRKDGKSRIKIKIQKYVVKKNRDTLCHTLHYASRTRYFVRLIDLLCGVKKEKKGRRRCTHPR